MIGMKLQWQTKNHFVYI